MADKEFTQICKEILGIGKRLEKIEPEELREIKASIERVNEAFNASKALFDESKDDFDGKYNKVAQILATFDTLKAQIEEVLKSGTINDSTEALIFTFSSKKIVDLLNEVKSVIDEKFSTIHKNGIIPWSSTLEYPAGAISVLNGKLYQAKTQNTNKKPSENKEIWHVIANKEWCEQTFLNKDDNIDAYNKQESDDKFVAKEDIATEDSAGIFKVTNEITGSRNDVVVTEKAVANNALSFEPYNKVDVELFDFLGIAEAHNTKDILGDSSCVSLYTFETNSGEALTKAEYADTSKFGSKSLRFNQVSGETVKLKDTDNIAFKNDFTVTLWFNYDNTANAAVHKDHRIFSIQFFIDLSVSSIVNGIGCGVGNNGRWTVARAEKPFTTFANYKTDDWNFAVIKRTGAKVEFFMNDEKIDEIDNWSVDGSVATNSIELGHGGQPFKGNIDQVRIFNRALSDREIFNVKNEASSAGSATLALQGTVYLSDKSSVPGRYLNTVKAIEAQLTKAQQKANGTYFVKVKQDNSLELVSIRPEFHHKSTTTEYYLDGVWYDKSGNKLQPQTYLPYSVIVTSKSITSVNFENIYPSAKEIGIGQRWVNETKNRQFGVTYTNSSSRAIQISVGYTYTASNGLIVYINGEPESPVNSSTGSRTLTIPPLSTYKIVGVATAVLVSWLELK